MIRVYLMAGTAVLLALLFASTMFYREAAKSAEAEVARLQVVETALREQRAADQAALTEKEAALAVAEGETQEAQNELFRMSIDARERALSSPFSFGAGHAARIRSYGLWLDRASGKDTPATE